MIKIWIQIIITNFSFNIILNYRKSTLMGQKSFTRVITFATVALLISLYSCIPMVTSKTKIVYDKVKKTYIVKWGKSTSARSKVDNKYRNFYLEMRKMRLANDSLSLYISSNFLITEPDYLPEAYFMWGKKIEKVDFENLKTLEYLENQNIINTATTTQTDVRTDNTSTTEPAKSDARSAETVKKTETTTTTNVSTDTNIQSEILNKVSSIRSMKVSEEMIDEIIKLSKTQTPMYIRLYNTNNDFWDIKLSTTDLIPLEEFFTGKKRN